MRKRVRYFACSVSINLVVALIVAVSPTLPLFAQESSSESNQLQRELEIMKNILSTTLSFLNRSEETTGAVLPGHRRGFEVGRVDALYLRAQGAVFSIAVDDAFLVDSEKFASIEKELARLEASDNPQKADAELQLLRAMTHERLPGLSALEAAAEAQALAALSENPEVQNAPMPVPEAGKKRSPDEVRKEIEKLKQSLTESKQQAEKNRRRLHEALVDALARYGDSLTGLAPDEFVNIVISPDSGFGWPVLGYGVRGFGMDAGTSEEPSEMIMTVRVSDIRDYRAGRIDLNSFKNRIEEY